MWRWRAVIFDLDGTLTDSAPAMGRALNAVWEDLGREPVDDAVVRGFIGDGPAVLIEKARARIGLPSTCADVQLETAAFMEAYAADGPGGDIYPGALETLQILHAAGIPMAVCTNKPQAAADHLLKALGFAQFLVGAVGGDATPKRKPDPAHALAALALFEGIQPEDCVLVGDGPQDVTSAEAAGIAAIVAAYGYGGAASLRPDLPAIDRIIDLPALLRA
ncbi:MAG: HAD-IA family hydrolase [Alphaproteobacteria bacterium]